MHLGNLLHFIFPYKRFENVRNFRKNIMVSLFSALMEDIYNSVIILIMHYLACVSCSLLRGIWNFITEFYLQFYKTKYFCCWVKVRNGFVTNTLPTCLEISLFLRTWIRGMYVFSYPLAFLPTICNWFACTHLFFPTHDVYVGSFALCFHAIK